MRFLNFFIEPILNDINFKSLIYNLECKSPSPRPRSKSLPENAAENLSKFSEILVGIKKTKKSEYDFRSSLVGTNGYIAPGETKAKVSSLNSSLLG